MALPGPDTLNHIISRGRDMPYACAYIYPYPYPYPYIYPYPYPYPYP